jgi:4-alpha-glucanotransferase
MEYRRAYKDETPDEWLVQRHEREIFPLMRRRHIFSGVNNFLLYDFWATGGGVNEDVFAYSNSSGDGLGTGERGLVLYNNKFAEARGWIRTSAAFSVKTGGDERVLVQKTLGEGLGLRNDWRYFTIFRDQVTGLEFIRNSQKLCDEGLYVELAAFKYQVFMDFREVEDLDGNYARLAALLNGRGVPSIDDALAEMLKPPEPEPVDPFPRASGILLHVTSLPGRFGIGNLGDAAYRFVDFLEASGQRYWQIMPLGPTSYGDSPYQALSTFAGNPLLISLERLVQDGLLAPWDLDGAPAFPDDHVDYGPVIKFKDRLLRVSHFHFKTNGSEALVGELAAYTARNKWWLDDYALFAALKGQAAARGAGDNWGAWETGLATRQPEALEAARASLSEEIRFHEYVQFLFDRQWSALKTYANERGISIIGDVPIFVAYDSADAWANQGLFHFDGHGKPTLVAGVPPDYFSPTGQLWGNPLYDWEAMEAGGYAWWIGRFKRAFQFVDVVRLDHFRGFEASWAVPVAEETAENGEWVKGPGKKLFDAVEDALGSVRFIAEDLGLITPEVEALREACGFPGMRVLQFAFSGEPENLYLPHNYDSNTVVYTGTHDNDTALGWFHAASEEERSHLSSYLGCPSDEVNWRLIRLALSSVAHTAVVPLQDVLGLGGEGTGAGRMNTPGKASGNWGWRYTPGMLAPALSQRLGELTEIYGRAPSLPDDEIAEEA